MPKHGKKYKKSISEIDRTKKYNLEEAISISKKIAFANFDESLDIAIKLGIDVKHSDQNVRGTIVLPNGTGKKSTVLVFAKGEKEKEAKDAGADFVGLEKFITKIEGGWMDFDKTVATPDTMSSVSKLGRILGPRGLMPNPKIGTVTFDLANVIKEIKAGKVDFKAEKSGIVHLSIGKISFKVSELLENTKSFLEAIIKMKPEASKGQYLRGMTISTTIGPGIPIDHITIAKEIA